MTDDELLGVLEAAVDAVAGVLAEQHEWGPSGQRAGQYASDLVADAAALGVLHDAGLVVVSEESGRTEPAGGAVGDLVAVIDPLDGSTNASRGVPWYAASLCALDVDGPRAAVVADLARPRRYVAVRGGGAERRDDSGGRSVPTPSGCRSLGDAFVALSGWPSEHLGWRQYRALGAAALDMCAVADGTVDAYLDCSPGAHGAWDYLGALLVCQEAGAVVADAAGRDLVTADHGARRAPVAAATAELLAEVIAGHGRIGDRSPSPGS